MVIIDRHLNGKKKRSLDAEGSYNLSLSLSPTWLLHGKLLATFKEAASLTQC